jgi:hypothetical protein
MDSTPNGGRQSHRERRIIRARGMRLIVRWLPGGRMGIAIMADAESLDPLAWIEVDAHHARSIAGLIQAGLAEPEGRA